jgi:dTDP-glucose 4,6-dehydratase
VRVLVTGGAGFIGSHFVKRLLARGDEVAVLDKLTYSGNPANLDGAVPIYEGDICDVETVRAAAAGCDAIVNFAAESHVDRSIIDAEDFVETNVLGAHVVASVAHELGVRLVHVSTDEVYGDVDAPHRSRETDLLRPSSPYAASKAGGDLHVLAAVRTLGLDAVITRGANTYGTHQYPEKLIPLMATNALDGLELPVYGDGRQIREWLHARDHCAAIELVLHEGAPGEIYNVAGVERENLDVVRCIVEATGCDPALVRHDDDRPGHDRRYALDDAKLRALGWSRQVSFEEGLQDVIAWYRDHRSWWEQIKSGAFRTFYEAQYASRLERE